VKRESTITIGRLAACNHTGVSIRLVCQAHVASAVDLAMAASARDALAGAGVRIEDLVSRALRQAGTTARTEVVLTATGTVKADQPRVLAALLVPLAGLSRAATAGAAPLALATGGGAGLPQAECRQAGLERHEPARNHP
jgi:hypothetical protein